MLRRTAFSAARVLRSVPARATGTRMATSLNQPVNPLIQHQENDKHSIKLLGPHGPVINLDIKESSVELSPAFARHRTEMPFAGSEPIIACETFIAPNCTLIGSVQIGDSTCIMYGTIVRGDENSVTVGSRTTIYENCVVSADCEATDISVDMEGTGGRVEGFPGRTQIGDDVTVGAGSILRACTVQDGAVIGAGSLVCEGALVEAGAVVGPGSLLPPGRRVPAGELWSGSPAEFVKVLTPADVEEFAASNKNDQETSLQHESFVYPVGMEYSSIHADAEAQQAKGL